MINWKDELGVIRPEFGAGVKAFSPSVWVAFPLGRGVALTASWG